MRKTALEEADLAKNLQPHTKDAGHLQKGGSLRGLGGIGREPEDETHGPLLVQLKPGGRERRGRENGEGRTREMVIAGTRRDESMVSGVLKSYSA